MGEAPKGHPTRSPPGPGGTGARGAGNLFGCTIPQGNPGGYSSQNGETAGGGGGGVTEAGVASPGPQSPIAGGRGGAGAPNDISGSALSYGGGGGGGIGYNGAPGPGTAGAASPCGTGGAGSKANCGTGGTGTTNRGGGGGGVQGSYNPSYNNMGGAGGSGVILLRAPGPLGPTFTVAPGTNSKSTLPGPAGGCTVMTFTVSGTLTIS